MYRMIRLFTNYRKFLPKIVSLGSKIGKKSESTRSYVRAYVRGELIRGETQVYRKRWAYLRGGGGGEIGYYGVHCVKIVTLLSASL